MQTLLLFLHGNIITAVICDDSDEPFISIQLAFNKIFSHPHVLPCTKERSSKGHHSFLLHLILVFRNCLAEKEGLSDSERGEMWEIDFPE